MCYYCGKSPDTDRIYRDSTCPFCGRDLKCCLNCVFYSKGSYRDCRESVPEEVRDKEKANFCEYFRYGDRTASGSDNLKKAQDAKNDFLKLFGGL